MRTWTRTAAACVVSAAALATACDGNGASGAAGNGGGGPSGGDGGTAGAGAAGGISGATGAGDGYHLLEVVQPHGTERVWIYAASPASGGPRPVVVYARGQGSGDVANCKPGAAADAFWSSTPPVADQLARAGYVAVALEYRNKGSDAPPLGEIRYRDHDLFDTRTLLAAARWARDEHGRGSAKIAFVGESMGTWPAFWAVTTRPDVADLQAGLDVRTTILVGETANHLANQSRGSADLVGTDEEQRARAVIGSTLTVVLSHARSLGLPSIEESDLDAGASLREAVATGLTARGVDLFREVFLRDHGGAAPCTAGVPAICDDACLGAMLVARFVGDGSGLGPTSDYLTAEGVESREFWMPPDRLDPGPDHPNPILRSLREGSPIFAAAGPLVTSRAASLLSENDPHFSRESRDLLLQKLTALGASSLLAPTIVADATGGCRHLDYLDEMRDCGIHEILDELAAAFGE